VYTDGNLTAAECIRQAVDGVRTLTANRKGATVPKNRCAFSLDAYRFVVFRKLIEPARKLGRIREKLRATPAHNFLRGASG
jgi:cell division FtsZ-interacting protein ZapD